MKRQLQFFAAVAAFCLFVGCVTASGQATTGTILGTVKDSSGAAMPGINVTATNANTNFARTAVSGPTGHFEIQYLPVGTYRVEVSATGFKKFVQTGIVIAVDRNARIDPVMHVGSVTESIEVIADAPLVDTTKTALGQTVSNAEINNLPLVNRDVYGLLNMTAAVSHSAATNSFGPRGKRCRSTARRTPEPAASTTHWMAGPA